MGMDETIRCATTYKYFVPFCLPFKRLTRCLSSAKEDICRMNLKTTTSTLLSRLAVAGLAQSSFLPITLPMYPSQAQMALAGETARGCVIYG